MAKKKNQDNNNKLCNKNKALGLGLTNQKQEKLHLYSQRRGV